MAVPEIQKPCYTEEETVASRGDKRRRFAHQTRTYLKLEEEGKLTSEYRRWGQKWSYFIKQYVESRIAKGINPTGSRSKS